jgi:hypothetical protein
MHNIKYLIVYVDIFLCFRLYLIYTGNLADWIYSYTTEEMFDLQSGWKSCLVSKTSRQGVELIQTLIQ